ncbi:MAG: hypothetical protein ACYTJ0_03065 [Planctomycetota bacterium]
MSTHHPARLVPFVALTILLAACEGGDPTSTAASTGTVLREPGRVELSGTGCSVELAVAEGFARYRILNADGFSIAASSFGSAAEPWASFVEPIDGDGSGYAVWLRGSLGVLRTEVTASGAAPASLAEGDPRLEQMPPELAAAF